MVSKNTNSTSALSEMYKSILEDTKAQTRFWDKVAIAGLDECWEWLGWRGANRYGQFGFGKRQPMAHRVSYMLMVGPIPDGLTLDHTCKNTYCVNPTHLEPVTVRDNILRGGGVAAINAKKTFCLAGHPYDLFNTYIETSGKRACRTCKLKREEKRLPRKR